MNGWERRGFFCPSIRVEGGWNWKMNSLQPHGEDWLEQESSVDAKSKEKVWKWYLLGLNMSSQIVLYCKWKILNYTVENLHNTMTG